VRSAILATAGLLISLDVVATINIAAVLLGQIKMRQLVKPYYVATHIKLCAFDLWPFGLICTPICPTLVMFTLVLILLNRLHLQRFGRNFLSGHISETVRD